MGGNGEFNEYSFCWSNENILEIDRGDGYTTLQIDLMPLIVHFKMVEMVALRLCIFYAIKKVSWECLILIMKEFPVIL